MKKQKHATSSPAELGKLLRILGTKKQREREPLAWYRTERGLAVRLSAGSGVIVIAGEPGTVSAAARGEIGTSRASFTGRVDSITGAGAEVVHAYQAADAIEGTDTRKEEPAGEPVESWRLPEEMMDALGWCVKATASDEARLTLQTVAVQSVAGGVRLVAGDNYRITPSELRHRNAGEGREGAGAATTETRGRVSGKPGRAGSRAVSQAHRHNRGARILRNLERHRQRLARLQERRTRTGGRNR